MNTSQTNTLRTALLALPKVDLHRHLEGSIRLTTLVDVARQYDIDLPAYDLETLRPYVQVMPGTPSSARNFLSKFDYLRRFYCAPEIIQRITREAIEDAAHDNIRYLELRFTPKALSAARKFSFADVVRWVGESAQETARQTGVMVRLIVSVNRHESLTDAQTVLQVALDNRALGVIGLDLAGAEGEYPARPFFDLFREAQQEHLGVTIHAGEWSGPENVRDAIGIVGAPRIGHGVRIIEDDDVLQMAGERATVLEICVTSNIQSGVVPGIEFHPLGKLFRANVNTTINTDDPSVSNITLTDEFLLAVQKLNFTLDDLKQMTITAARGSFLGEAERSDLVKTIEAEQALIHQSGAVE